MIIIMHGPVTVAADKDSLAVSTSGDGFLHITLASGDILNLRPSGEVIMENLDSGRAYSFMIPPVRDVRASRMRLEKAP